MLHKNLSFLDTVLAASKNTTFEDVKWFASKVLTYAPDYPGGGSWKDRKGKNRWEGQKCLNVYYAGSQIQKVYNFRQRFRN